jgi:hypothetical protein
MAVSGKVQVGKEEVAMWKIRLCLFRGGGRSLKLVRDERERSLLWDEVMRLEGRAAPLGCAVLCKYFTKVRRTFSVGIRMWLRSPPRNRGLGSGVAGGHRGWLDVVQIQMDGEEGRARGASIRIETRWITIDQNDSAEQVERMT